MSITVLDCLKLPSLREGVVISGHKGLDHIVNNISVLEVMDLSVVRKDKSINNFEISLTSFAGVSNDCEAQCELVRHLHNIGDVGLIIYYYGIVLKEISEELKKLSDELGFPIIVMPKDRLDFKYSEAIRDVSEFILSKQIEERNMYSTIASTLAKLPKAKQTFSNILTISSDILRSTLLISNIAGDKSIQSSWPVSNPIHYSTIIGLFSSNANNDDEHVVANYLEKEINVYRIALMTKRLHHYYLYIFDEFRRVTLQDARQIADLVQLFSEIWNVDDEISSFNVIQALLEDDLESVKKHAYLNGINWDKLDTVLCLSSGLNLNDINESIQVRMTIEEKIKSIADDNLINSFICKYEYYYFVFFDSNNINYINHPFVHELLTSILHEDVSSFFVFSSNTSGFKQAFQLFEDYGTQTDAIFRRQIITYTDLLFTHSCCEFFKSDDEILKSFENAINRIQICTDADDLINTLCTYFLDTNCRVDLSSSILYVHRNTIKYRINKSFKLLGLEPDIPSNLFYIQSLMAYYRLKDSDLL